MKSVAPLSFSPPFSLSLSSVVIRYSDNRYTHIQVPLDFTRDGIATDMCLQVNNARHTSTHIVPAKSQRCINGTDIEDLLRGFNNTYKEVFLLPGSNLCEKARSVCEGNNKSLETGAWVFAKNYEIRIGIPSPRRRIK